jgi:hypothetical protein
VAQRRFTSCILTTILSLLLVAALLISSLVEPSAEKNGISRQSQAAAPRGETGPPRPGLPNLDQVRKQKPVEPKALLPIESIMRGRRKPLEPRNGRKVGDPGTQAEDETPSRNEGNHAQTGSNKPEPSVVTGGQKSHRSAKLNHAAKGNATALPPPLTGDQYVSGLLSDCASASAEFDRIILLA